MNGQKGADEKGHSHCEIPMLVKEDISIGRAAGATAVVRSDPYGHWWQHRNLAGYEWTHAILPVDHLPAALRGFRILHLTDLHLRDQWPAGMDEILDRIADRFPDLILHTGDFVDDRFDHRPAMPHLQRFLERLRSRLGTYGILGNHDGLALRADLADLPVTLLDGQRVCLEPGGADIELIGLPGPYRYDLKESFLRSIPPSVSPGVRLVLSHFPGHWPRAARLRPDIFLAGHTHGGQICLPWRIPILKHDPMPRRLCRGIHRLEQSWYVVGRGLGFSGFPLRVFCPSQVIEIELA